jgi:outer membrane protein assembly factor BamB
LLYVLKSNSGEKYWVFTTEDAVKSSPTVDPTTGLVFVGSHDHHVYALDIYVRIHHISLKNISTEEQETVRCC